MADGVAPDVRDGLTPVCRRALLALGALRARTPVRQNSARTLDAVLRAERVDGGRRAIYGELVRMARDWEMRHPLVDAEGNLGSLDGDVAVSPDYTEMRLAALGEELLRDVRAEADAPPDLESDGASQALPARFPNLLVNGSFSVATGSGSCVPPHNLREVVDAVIALIDDPDIDTAGLMRHMRGPDFPTGAVVAGGQELHDAYAAGRGSLTVRARMQVEAGTRTPGSIVVTELPFMVRKGSRSGVVAEIGRATRSKRVRGVYEIDDQSSQANGLRIVIELKRDADSDAVLEALHEHTRLQTTYELALVATVGGQARTIGLSEAIGHYVEHRRDVVARRTGLRCEDRVLDIVRRDLLDIAASHGDERRTEIC